MNNTIEIKGKRLRITSTKVEEAALYYENFTEEVVKYQLANSFKSIKEAESFLQEFMELGIDGDNTMLSLWNEEDKFVGSIELYNLKDECPEVGIWICEDERKKGYAYEALLLIKDFLKENYKIEGLIFAADILNIPSLQLINKLNGKKMSFDIVSDFGKVLKLESYIF